MQKDLIVGVDIGSVSVKVALLDHEGSLCAERSSRIKGDPLSALAVELTALANDFPEERITAAGITGSGGKKIADAVGAVFINEVLAQAAFACGFHPHARTIIEMGGEDAKLISLEPDAERGLRIGDFSMNAACAAGTGSFLDQQAHRLHLSIEEFAGLALRSKQPPAVAGRCSVFAKSDMIHLQQIATPDHDIVAGLCFAMARNYKATVGKGRTFAPPVLFLGGVAANAGMGRALRSVLGLGEDELVVPAHHQTSGAIGAALMVMKGGDRTVRYRGLAAIAALRTADREEAGPGLSPLAQPSRVMRNPEQNAGFASDVVIDAYLGVDVGSVSTNVVLIDSKMNVLAKRYLPTAGRPIEAVKQGLAEVGAEVAGRVRIRGAATTGSGRYLTGDMIGADVVRNEITAQATAAAAIDSRVDTIFEIGGQDSKFISLSEGAVVDFEMNRACAAGTGSFLEEQAERLGIRIKREFEERALCATSPCGLGERCTVFMESDLVHYLNRGAGVDELSAGLAYSIAQNYLNKVVAGKRVGEHIFFQGGVAANRAVVSAFERIIGRPVTVPPHHEVTGAIGAAILALRERGSAPSSFKGFDLSKRSYTVTTFACAECENRCDIRRVSFEGEQPLFYGSRCEKYDVKRSASQRERPVDLFTERERILDHYCSSPEGDGPVLGIPRMLYVNDRLPFWLSFFSGLGFRAVLSSRTNRTIITKGLEAAAAETCFPAKAALGHVQDLIGKNVDILFLPSIIRFPALPGGNGSSQACPYAQSFPYMARAGFDLDGVRTIDLPVLAQDDRSLSESMQRIGKELGKSRRAVQQALARAREVQQRYETAIEERGREFLASLPRGQKALVLIGRTYNTCDPGMNLNLPAKIRDLGVPAVPLDFLPLHSADLSDAPNMYWRSGQKILAAAKLIREHPDLYPVYLTNFGCGPDSFISHFFRKEMRGKPYLQLEIDEHSADAGAITRIEAFLDSLRHAGGRTAPKAFAIRSNGSGYARKVLLPAMADHAHVIAAAFRASGVEAEVLPESDRETVAIGKKHSSGRECYPLALTTGDMIKALRKPGFDPRKTAFFMPSGKGPCRFGQYNHYQRQVLDGLGYGDVPIVAPMQNEGIYRELGGNVGKDLVRLCWQGSLAVDILQKALHEQRPYEKQKGAADAVYERALANVARAIAAKQDPVPSLKTAYHELAEACGTERTRPVIGIVGEIYIRGNRFGNEDIIRRIEQLGGEAWLAPLSEWILYLNATAKVSARMKRSWKDLLKASFAHHVMMRDERRFLSGFNGSLRSLHEPRIEETLELAAPYIHRSFEGEAVLSVGKAIDFINRGVSGIVNVMPFSCMPGTIASAVLKRVREDFGGIPLLTIAYDGQQDTQTVTRLEAFMHQAKGFRLAGRA